MTRLLFLLFLAIQPTVLFATDHTIGTYNLHHTLKTDLNTPEGIHAAWDEVHTVSTLQGIVNRNNPCLYVYFVKNGDMDVDSYWWNIYRQPGEWLYGKDTITYHYLEELVEAYRQEIKGVVLYDSNVPSTSNIASAIAGIENVIAVRYDTTPGSIYDRLVAKGPRLNVKFRLVNPDGSPLSQEKKAA